MNSLLFYFIHILCMLVCILEGVEGHLVDELPCTMKVCMLPSLSASKKNGSFTFFLNSLAALEDKWHQLPLTSCLASIMWTSGSSFSPHHREKHSERMTRKKFNPPHPHLVDILPGPPFALSHISWALPPTSISCTVPQQTSDPNKQNKIQKKTSELCLHLCMYKYMCTFKCVC